MEYIDFDWDNENTRCGWVALAGLPNVGKSTLLNAYLGEKLAIISPKPQTTRNQIPGILSREDAQVIFLDTPGLHNKRGLMNKLLIQSAQQAFMQANALILVLDAAKCVNSPERMDKDFARLATHLKQCSLPMFIAANKVDVVKDKGKLLPVMERIAEAWPDAQIFPVSALREQGLDKLLDAVVEVLPKGAPMYPEDQLSTAPLKFMAAEIIREKYFIQLRQELPYSLTIDIEFWDESEPGLVRISALVYIARSHHKGMVIGKRGALIKQVGTQARVELEELLDQKVFLELHVKVREGWTEDAGFLRSLGFTE